jgi:hypothetical protein
LLPSFGVEGWWELPGPDRVGRRPLTARRRPDGAENLGQYGRGLTRGNPCSRCLVRIYGDQRARDTVAWRDSLRLLVARSRLPTSMASVGPCMVAATTSSQPSVMGPLQLLTRKRDASALDASVVPLPREWSLRHGRQASSALLGFSRGWTPSQDGSRTSSLADENLASATKPVGKRPDSARGPSARGYGPPHRGAAKKRDADRE